MTISQHKVVSIHYKVADASSEEVIDTSEGGEPMAYLHGAQNIIPGLERALEARNNRDPVLDGSLDSVQNLISAKLQADIELSKSLSERTAMHDRLIRAEATISELETAL